MNSFVLLLGSEPIPEGAGHALCVAPYFGSGSIQAGDCIVDVARATKGKNGWRITGWLTRLSGGEA